MERIDRRGRRMPLLAVTVAVAVAACGGDGGTDVATDYEPQRTLDHVDAVLTGLDPFEDAALGIEQAVSTIQEYDAGAFLADALRRERRPGDAVRRIVEGVRAAATAAPRADAAGTAALVLPSAILGETLVWDPAQGYVVDASRSDAPSNGVRFVLYRMDPGYEPAIPLEPLAEIGYVDILDQDGARSERVGVRAVASGGSILADYFVDLSGVGTGTEGELTLRMSGDVTGGARTVDMDVIQQYTWSESRNLDELDMDYTFDTDARSLHLEGLARSPYNVFPYRDLQLNTTFSGDGPVIEADLTIGSNDALDGVIRSNGRTAVVVSGTDGSPQFSGAGGIQLSQTDIYTLEQLWWGITDLIVYTEWRLLPADLLWLAG